MSTQSHHHRSDGSASPPRVVLLSTELGPDAVDSWKARPGIDSAGRLLADFIGRKDREHLVALHLDTQHSIMGVELLGIGILAEGLVHPREVFKGAIVSNAAAIIIGHNHPSGNLEPSPNDHDMRRALEAAGNTLGIPVLDFLVVHDTDWRSITPPPTAE